MAPTSQPPNMLFPLPRMLFPLLLTWLATMHPCSSHWLSRLITCPSLSPAWNRLLPAFLMTIHPWSCRFGCLTSAPQLPRVSAPCSVKTCMSLPLDRDLLGTGDPQGAVDPQSRAWCPAHSMCVCSVTWLYPTLCDPMDCSLPGSSVHVIFQARILELGCHFLLQGSFLAQSMCSDAQSCPTLYDPMVYSLCQTPLSMGFSWQEYWSE